MLRIGGVSKTYPGGIHALRDVSLAIPCGMFGLLGPNGAGKTTLMRAIATLSEPDEGQIFFGDLDVRKDKDAVRRLLGYLPQEASVFRSLSGWSGCSSTCIANGRSCCSATRQRCATSSGLPSDI